MSKPTWTQLIYFEELDACIDILIYFFNNTFFNHYGHSFIYLFLLFCCVPWGLNDLYLSHRNAVLIPCCFGCRYMSQEKHAEARELMYNGALLFFSYNQVCVPLYQFKVNNLSCHVISEQVSCYWFCEPLSSVRSLH